MRLLFVADARSPIAVNWIQYLIDRGVEVHLASTFPCTPDLRLASFKFIPVAFSAFKADKNAPQQKQRFHWLQGAAGFKTRFRHVLGPFTVRSASRALGALIEEVCPDLIHAMRIPYEGMLAAEALRGLSKNGDRPRAPFLVSIWGNDFTLHAPTTPWMRKHTRFTLQAASAIHADCHRDVRLARVWGFDPTKPNIVLPGAGGVQKEIFYFPVTPIRQPWVINPRGFRAYVNNSAFFRAIPMVIDRVPQARFICPSMANVPQAVQWVKDLHISEVVDLLPLQTRTQMAQLFRQSRVAVSPSNHDGTPNTLLEAMACGCLPIAGDLESIREWITSGENGLLIDPNNPAAIAAAILHALDDEELQKKAWTVNANLIAERAEHQLVMSKAVDFYQGLLTQKIFSC